MRRFNLLDLTEKATQALYVKNASRTSSPTGSRRLASTAIPSPRSLAVNANDVQTRRNVMARRSRANNASRSVPSIDRTKIRR